MVNVRQFLSSSAPRLPRVVVGRIACPIAGCLAVPPLAIAAGLMLGLGLATVGDSLAYAQGVTAGSSDAFTVSGVSVDVSAPDTNAARDRAIAQAQRKAWDELARRNAPGRAAPPVDDATLSRAVQNFSVDDERLAPGRYQASMTFRFRPEVVRQVLGASAGSAVAAEAPSGDKPLLVLPVTVQADGTPVLWEDRTPWRAAWEDRDANPAQAKSLVKLDVPFGDLPDVAAASAADALAGNKAALGKIAALHNASGVAVIKTTLPAAGAVAPMQVAVTLFALDGAQGTKTVTVRPDTDDRPADLLNRAVVFSAAAVDELWREQHTLAAGPQQSLIVTAPVASLPAWIDMRQRLGQLGAGVRVDLLSLNRTAATVAIAYRGDIGAVQSEAARQGLMLAQSAGGWMVSAAPAPTSAPTSAPTPPMPAVPAVPR